MLSDKDILLNQDLLLIMKTLQAMKEVMQEFHDIADYDNAVYESKCKLCGFYMRSSAPHNPDCKWAKLQKLFESIDNKVEWKQNG